jgi:PBP1b-binding outer membrane lipoprotein LpoB
MKSSASTCLLLATTLLLAGCNTPTHTATAASPVEPKSVQTSSEGDKILVYQFDVLTAQKMVPTDMKEIPAYDPVTGAPIKVMEPTYSPQNVTVYQTIVLQLKNGALASWARQLGEQRAFN